MKLTVRQEQITRVSGITIDLATAEAQTLVKQIETLKARVVSGSILSRLGRDILGLVNGTALDPVSQRAAEDDELPDGHGEDCVRPYMPWQGSAAPLPSKAGVAQMSSLVDRANDALLNVVDREGLARVSFRRMLRDFYRHGFHTGVDWHRAQIKKDGAVEHGDRQFLTSLWNNRAQAFRKRCSDGQDARGADTARLMEVMVAELNTRCNGRHVATGVTVQRGEPESLEPVDEPTPLPSIDVFGGEAMSRMQSAAIALGTSKNNRALTDLFSFAYSKGATDSERRWAG